MSTLEKRLKKTKIKLKNGETLKAYKLKKKIPLKRKVTLTLRVLPWGLLIGFTLGVYFWGLPVNIKTETKVIEKKVVVDNSLKNKIESLKHGILEDLRTAEVQGYEHMDAIIVFDPLKKDLESCRRVGGVKLHCYSFGHFNFKIETVKYYYGKFYNKTLTDKEAMDIALDNDKAYDLAYKVIFDEVGGIYNWINSGKKINAVERIELIRELEK